jgi:UDP-N-acetylmuramoyl-tripeptide--D-alanyl-D-alanine ligase
MTENSKPWTVSDALQATDGRLVLGNEAARFQAISTDSRTTKAGDLFVAITGPNHDGIEGPMVFW